MHILFGFVQTTSSAQQSAKSCISLPSKKLVSRFVSASRFEEDNVNEEQMEQDKMAARSKRFSYADPRPAL
jgi:hypothetical protein